jgi:hypothetical protein
MAVRGLLQIALSSLVMASLSGYAALSPTSPTPPQPTIKEPPAKDLTVHDPLDLIFNATQLRRKSVTVRTTVICLKDLICILDLPNLTDDVISVRLEGFPLS